MYAVTVSDEKTNNGFIYIAQKTHACANDQRFTGIDYIDALVRRVCKLRSHNFRASVTVSIGETQGRELLLRRLCRFVRTGCPRLISFLTLHHDLLVVVEHL